MSKKVTGNDLKKLLEGVLSEVDNVKIAGIDKKLYKKKKDEFDNFKDGIKDLASNDKSPGSISQVDVTTAYTEPDQDEIDAARYLGQGLRMTHKADRENMLKFVGNAEAEEAEFSAQAVESVPAEKIRSIAFKSMQNLSADPAKTSTPMGQFPEGIATALNEVMAGKNTFDDRMKHLAIVCQEAVNDMSNNTKTSADVTDTISKMLVLDYLTTLVREVDSGSGAYEFEAFLAMLVGGRVTGKELTADKKMGGADFRAPDGSAGSSKFYSNLSGITQSSKGFKLNEPVYYVICIKEKTKPVAGEGASVTKLKIYTLFVNKVAEKVGTAKGKIYDYFAFKYANGDVEIQEIKTGSQLNLSKGLSKKGTPLEIDIVTAKNSKDIRAVVTAMTSTRTDDFAKAIKYMEQISRKIYVADQKSQSYGASGDIDTADEALKALMQAENSVRLMTSIIDPTQSRGGDESKFIAEQKITPDFLKKIIEESFKK